MACSQSKINQALKHELDSIYVEDQLYREILFDEKYKNKKDSLIKAYNIIRDFNEFFNEKMYLADVSNMKRVEKIIEKYGYPGKSLVGEPTNEAVFYVLQHSPKINQYISIVEKAAKENELKFTFYAMMLDRSLLSQNKMQIYGTQGYGFQTKSQGFKNVIWPIENPEKVNELRKKVGFKKTVEESAKSMNIEYQILTLEMINKMIVE
jgi:hypothetical protein